MLKVTNSISSNENVAVQYVYDQRELNLQYSLQQTTTNIGSLITQ